MITFEDNIPRSLEFKIPHYDKDPNFSRKYKKTVVKCAFPSVFVNGLFNLILGLWICIVGIVCLMLGYERFGKPTTMLLGIVAATVLSAIYGRYMQTRVVFPRGGCLPYTAEKTKTYMWLIPLIVYIGLAVFAIVGSAVLMVQITLGAFFGCLEILAYRYSNKSSMLFASLLLVALPTITAYLGIANTTDIYAAIVTNAPTNGIVLVFLGTWCLQRSMAPLNRNANDTQVIARNLSSSNYKDRFIAVNRLCNKVDYDLLPDLIKLTVDKEEIVAHIAQMALSNIWGPRPREMSMPTKAVIPPEAPEAQAEAFRTQYETRRSSLLESWKEHNKRVEKAIRQIADDFNDDKRPCEIIFELASGEGVLYKPVRRVAIEMLGPMRTPKAYASLMQLIQHKNKEVNQAAIASFYGADSKAILYLEKFFTAKHPWQRIRAIRAARCLLDYLAVFDKSDADVAQALLNQNIDVLFNTDDTCTFAATISLLPCEESQDVDVIEEYCMNPRPIIKIAALFALIKHQPQINAAKWVVPALGDASAVVRYAAILGVEKLRLGDSDRHYKKMLTDPNKMVANLAQEVLQRFEALKKPLPN